MTHFMGVGIFRIGLNRTHLGCWRLTLRLLTHVRLVRQNVLILSEVSLYVERSKNLEKNMSSPCKKNSPS